MRIELLVGLMGALLVGTGCANLEVDLEGTLRSAPRPTHSGGPNGPLLAFDRLGNLTINGYNLDLPRAQEHARFGVAFLDASSLPPPWRPEHLPDGGPLVSALHKSSCLALAGLRPFDGVVAIGDVPVGSPAAAVAALEAVPPDTPVDVTVLRADGTAHVLQVTPPESLGGRGWVHIPFLFDRRESTTGAAFGLGPLDLLFYDRDAVEHAYVPQPGGRLSRYADASEWGLLANIVQYRSLTDRESGETRSQVTLFWFLDLGDEL